MSPTANPTRLSTKVPTHVPTKQPSISPSSIPTILPTKSQTSSPTFGLIDFSGTNVPSITPSLKPTLLTTSQLSPESQTQTGVAIQPVPACDFSKRVGYQCGPDTVVCNSEQFSPAQEVCNVQPILEGGQLYDWQDALSTEECDVLFQNSNGNIPESCWCRHMELGVSTAGPTDQTLFPTSVECPNGQFVISYVCYRPLNGGNYFKVNGVDSDNDGSFVESCTGYQSRDSLPPVMQPTQSPIVN
jgi:hypothetical protein